MKNLMFAGPHWKQILCLMIFFENESYTAINFKGVWIFVFSNWNHSRSQLGAIDSKKTQQVTICNNQIRESDGAFAFALIRCNTLSLRGESKNNRTRTLCYHFFVISYLLRKSDTVEIWMRTSRIIHELVSSVYSQPATAAKTIEARSTRSCAFILSMPTLQFQFCSWYLQGVS